LTGQISVIPTTEGTSQFKVEVIDAQDRTAFIGFSITVA